MEHLYKFPQSDAFKQAILEAKEMIYNPAAQAFRALSLDLMGDCGKLKAENAALRAAVKEMERMLPVLEYIEKNAQSFLESASGVTNLNNYRQTLETALAKMNESEAQK